MWLILFPGLTRKTVPAKSNAVKKVRRGNGEEMKMNGLERQNLGRRSWQWKKYIYSVLLQALGRSRAFNFVSSETVISESPMPHRLISCQAGNTSWNLYLDFQPRLQHQGTPFVDLARSLSARSCQLESWLTMSGRSGVRCRTTAGKSETSHLCRDCEQPEMKARRRQWKTST